MKKKLLVLLILASIAFSGCSRQVAVSNVPDNAAAGINATPPTQDLTPSTTPKAPAPDSTSTVNSAIPTQTKKSPPPSSTPPTVDLAVPFTPQAPFGVWDSLHEEACEEAAMIMASAYFKHETLTPHVAEQAILQLVKWESEHGYQVDVTAAEAAAILKNYFSLSASVSADVSVAHMIKELAAGNIILVPAAGRRLGNPYFTAPGPIYHMLVIRGYDQASRQFITNDPGTKRGEAYRYDYQVLIGAIADWDHQAALGGMTDEEMANAPKNIIIVSK